MVALWRARPCGSPKACLRIKDCQIPTTSLTHVKVSVRRSCLRDWTKYTMEMHRKKRMGRFYMQHFGIGSTHWKACKTITAKRTYAALNQLKLGHGYFRSYLIRTPNCESDRCTILQ